MLTYCSQKSVCFQYFFFAVFVFMAVLFHLFLFLYCQYSVKLYSINLSTLLGGGGSFIMSDNSSNFFRYTKLRYLSMVYQPIGDMMIPQGFTLIGRLMSWCVLIGPLLTWRILYATQDVVSFTELYTLTKEEQS